jgi:hypothetical protein
VSVVDRDVDDVAPEVEVMQHTYPVRVTERVRFAKDIPIVFEVVIRATRRSHASRNGQRMHERFPKVIIPVGFIRRWLGDRDGKV